MAKIQYTYVPLDKATIIDRRHQREVQPPGMVNLENFIPSRSDSAPTMRPDWRYTSDKVYAISDILTLPGISTLRDILNSANGLYGSDQVTFFTTYIPYGNDNGTWRVLSGTHGDGTVSAAAGESFIKGLNTTLLENAHRGAIIKVPSGAVGTYTGAPHLFSESATTGEWYLTELDETEYSLISDELYWVSANDGSKYVIDTAGAFAGSAKMDVADEDGLGFNAVYIRTDGTDPDFKTENDRAFATIETSKNISGSNYMWNASDNGTNEYYYTTRAAGEPFAAITGVQSSVYVRKGSRFQTISHPSTYYRINQSGTDLSIDDTYTEPQALTAGTVGSLAEFEIAYDDNETTPLGWDTVYVRDNTGSPDVMLSSKSPGSMSIGVYFDGDSSGYKWVKSTTYGSYYKLQTNAGGDPGIPQPDFCVQFLKTNKVDPGYLVTEIISGGYPAWVYGDFDEDGFSTVYFSPSHGGDPDVINYMLRIFYHKTLYGSNYSWTASAGGTSEYLMEQQNGSEISSDLDEPFSITVNGYYPTTTNSVRGAIGSLENGEWGYGKNGVDTLTYNTAYVRYNTGDPDTQELKVIARYRHNIYASAYKWVESPATSDEWYLTTTGETNPGIGDPANLDVDGVAYSEGTVGSLSATEYDYDDNDTLGYNTIYIYSTSDPNGTIGTGIGDEVEPFLVGSEASSDSFDHYIFDQIVDDESAYIYGEIQTSVSGVAPTIYYNHNPFLANQYKLNIQAYTSGLIYNAPTINDNLSEEDISGPFYADLQAGEWSYSSKVITDTVMLGSGIDKEAQYTYATNGGSYIQVWPMNTGTGNEVNEKRKVGISYGLTNDSWTDQWWYSGLVTEDLIEVTETVTIAGDGDDMRLNSIDSNGGTYLCSARVIDTGTAVRPGIARATDGIGLNWTTAADTGIPAWSDTSGYTKQLTEFEAISAAYAGTITGRFVSLNWLEADDSVYVRYSDDQGDNWNDVSIDGGIAVFSGSRHSRVKYINGQFVIISDTALIYGDGATFTTETITGVDDLRDVAFDGNQTYVIVENDFKVWYSDSTGITGTWTAATFPLDNSSYEETNFVIYDPIGERFVINSRDCFFWSDDGEDWSGTFFEPRINDVTLYPATNAISDSGGVTFCTAEAQGDGLAREDVRLNRFSFNYWDIIDFVPLSDIYRASTFSVLDGYVVLLGTREWDDTTEEWTYYPRRIRWTVPATYNNFEDEGSGTADANGEGAFLDSRPVNGRIVVFETNRVSAVVPRGFTEDPWDYDVVKEDFRILSNPVAVDDMCYVIGTDGLLYATDGVEVKETGSSFDITKFDDFNENKPIILDYSRQLNSLVVYYFNTSASENFAYLISLSGGSVTKISMPVFSDDSESLAENCAFITAVGDSSDQRLIASYHPFSTETDNVTTINLNSGSPITGKNIPSRESSANDTYSYSTLETGEIYLVPEGNKTSLKHIIVKTYSESPVGNSDRPRIIALIKSIDDDEWHVAGHPDTYSKYFISSAAAFPGDYNAGATQSDASVTQLWVTHTGATANYQITSSELPDGINANDCAIFTEEDGIYTQVKDYTVVGTDVIVTGVTDGTSVYVSWNNYPEIKLETGDFYDSSLGYIRVTGTNSTMSAGDAAPTFDRYLSSGLEDITDHYPSKQIPNGEGETIIGINKLLDGFQLKLIVVPEYGKVKTPSIVKITGISFGHIPQGRKTLQATGS